jgi:peroxiredoxin
VNRAKAQQMFADVFCVTFQRNQNGAGRHVCHFAEQIVLASKVVIKGLPCHASARCNAIHTGAVTFLHENFNSRAEQTIAVVVGNGFDKMAHKVSPLYF